jgi:hypothetical protein
MLDGGVKAGIGTRSATYDRPTRGAARSKPHSPYSAAPQRALRLPGAHRAPSGHASATLCVVMEGSDFEELTLFTAVRDCSARSLLIGRRALVALGLPVATYDYDFWLHADDVEVFNAALAAHDHFASCTPAEARSRGRYVIENGEHIDVLIARTRSTVAGEVLTFEEAWSRRQMLPFGATEIVLPSIEDLIRTKSWAMRAKDVADIQLLEALRRQR